MTENKLICPFCQQELRSTTAPYVNVGSYYCDKCHTMGDQKLWEEIIYLKNIEKQAKETIPDVVYRTNKVAYENADLRQELITTRKALDYAITMLERIAVSPETMLEPEKIIPQLAGQALERIKEITKGKTAEKSEELKNLELLVNNVFK